MEARIGTNADADFLPLLDHPTRKHIGVSTTRDLATLEVLEQWFLIRHPHRPQMQAVARSKPVYLG